MENDYYFSPDDPLYEVDTAEYRALDKTKSGYSIILYPRTRGNDGQTPKSINEYHPDDKKLIWLSFVAKHIGRYVDDFGLPPKGNFFMSGTSEYGLSCTIEDITPSYFEGIGGTEKTVYVYLLIES